MGEEKVEQVLKASYPAEIIAEFELLSITENEQLDRQVAKKLRERIDGFAATLEFIIQPDQSLTAMNEYSFFNEEEHRQIVQLYRKLMNLLRLFTVADLKGIYKEFNEKAIASWSALKEELLGICAKLQRGWEKEQPLQVERGYLG